MKKLFLIILSLTVPFSSFPNQVPQIKEGRVDLSSFNFENQKIIKLDGEWEFYYNRLLSSEEISKFSHEKNLISFPKVWNGSIVGNDTLSNIGFATYRLKLKLKPNQRYGFKFPYQATAFKVFVNGELAVETGRVSSNLDSIIPSYKNQYYYFKTKQTKNEIIIQIANNIHKKGGAWSSIEIGKKKEIRDSQYYLIFIQIFTAGALFIMALFHLIQFFNRNNEEALLSFAIFYFIIFARLITTGERVLLLGLPNLHFEVYHKIEYLSFFLAPPAFIIFIEKIFKNLVPKFAKVIVLSIPSIFIILTLFNDTSFNSYLIIPFQIVSLFFISYSIYLIIKSIKRKDKGAKLILYGTIIIIIGAINDILYANQTIKTIEITHFTVFIFSIFQAMAVSLRVQEIENKNNKLEAEFNTTKYLSEIGKEITSTLHVKDIFSSVYEHIKNLMSVDIFKFGIITQNNTINYLFIAEEGEIKEPDVKELSDCSILKNSIDNKKTLLIHNIEEEYFKYVYEKPKLLETDISSIICIPLIQFEKVVGVIIVQSYLENAFNRNNLNILESITAYAYIAYTNAKSFEHIENQKYEIEQQRDISLKQEREIKWSINYASKIQQAMLPAQNILKEMFDAHFIMFRPRDVVSGDFYWVRKVKDLVVIVAADCTGHGVPGAFVSMLGISILNKITINEQTKAGDILNELRNEVKFSLNQTGKNNELRDGMDLTFCIINTKTQKLQFAGANNHLYIITQNKLSEKTKENYMADKSFQILAEEINKSKKSFIEIKADRQPIGIYRKEKAFTTHHFKLQKGDKVYMFSDGFVDQFGGEKGHKFRLKYFKELLKTIEKEKMQRQKEILENTFKNWKAERKQIDDVLVMGVRI